MTTNQCWVRTASSSCPHLSPPARPPGWLGQAMVSVTEEQLGQFQSGVAPARLEDRPEVRESSVYTISNFPTCFTKCDDKGSVPRCVGGPP